MNKKNVLRMIMLLLVGGLIGFVTAMIIIIIGKEGLIEVGTRSINWMIANKIAIQLSLGIVGLTPAFYFAQKSIDAMNHMNANQDSTDENEYDNLQKKADKYSNLGITINSVFTFLSFMVFGITYKVSPLSTLIIHLILFLVIIIVSSSFEIRMVNYIKKNDTRLKGDPTTFKFQKDFIESMDEAEQLKVYKAGYNTFISSRNFGIGIIVISILCNIFFSTGALAIILSCVIVIAMQISYGYYSTK